MPSSYSTRRDWLLRFAPLPLAPLLASDCSSTIPRRTIPDARPRLGINLAGLAYWGSELPFADLLRTSSGWEMGDARGPASTTRATVRVLDALGWVTRLAPGTWAEKRLAAGPRIPTGLWTTQYEGQGRIEMRGLAQTAASTPGRIEFWIPPHDEGMLSLRLIETEPQDPVRNIRVIQPGLETASFSNPWSPSFLKRWSGVAALRFMDMMGTNGSAASDWALRPTAGHDTFLDRGVPAEWLIDLANRLDAEPWFCMPHQADTNYLESFAALVKERLKPHLRAWVEHSNEVWNWGFAQAEYSAAAGQAIGLARSAGEAQLRYHAQQSTHIFKTWEKVIGNSKRLVRVLATHAANPHATESMLAYARAHETADVLAIAPYVGLMPSPISSPSSDEVASWSLEQVFAALAQELLKQRKHLEQHARLASRHSLHLVAYEGGQHLVGVQGGENNDKLTALFIAANRDMRMANLYQELYAAWEASGGDLFCHYASVVGPSKWGCWGLLETRDQPRELAPKYRASMIWARRHGQAVTPQ